MGLLTNALQDLMPDAETFEKERCDTPNCSDDHYIGRDGNGQYVGWVNDDVVQRMEQINAGCTCNQNPCTCGGG